MAARSAQRPVPLAAGEAFVRAEGLGKRYGDAWALRGLTFEVRQGEILGVVGPNGAGKTTALKLLAGLLAPTEGRATAGGRSVEAPEHRARIGYLPEESPLYDELTPHAYLRFFADLYGVPRAVAEGRIAQALALLDLDAPPGRKCGDLSKGMRRKVALARSLVNAPDLLLYDEPASGLDPVVSATVLDLLRSLRAEGKTIILSAHNLYHLERLCDRVLILRRGALVLQGTMREIRAAAGGTEYVARFTVPVRGARPGEEGFEAVLDDLAQVQALEREAASLGGRLIAVEPRQLSLEEIFLRRVAR